MITTKILADSVNPRGTRLTSFLLTYPRFIHAEFMTHRIFSRNAASSRAIPLARMIQDIKDNPALPERWGAEQRGMQSGENLSAESERLVQYVWEDHCLEAIEAAEACGEQGLHKSLCNRLMEPWAHITVLATATDLSNFFKLRAHPAAMPEFQVLAYRMLDEYLRSKPCGVEWGDWHFPKFGNMEGVANEDILKVAAARCARLSYLTHDGKHEPAKDIELHDQLAEAGHWSPFEHVAQAVRGVHYLSNFDSFATSTSCGSCQATGWEQYRKRFDKENVVNLNAVDLMGIMDAKPGWISLP